MCLWIAWCKPQASTKVGVEVIRVARDDRWKKELGIEYMEDTNVYLKSDAMQLSALSWKVWLHIFSEMLRSELYYKMKLPKHQKLKDSWHRAHANNGFK